MFIHCIYIKSCQLWPVHTPVLNIYLVKIVLLKGRKSSKKATGGIFSPTTTKLHHLTVKHYPGLKVLFRAILSLKRVNTLPGLNTAPILNFLTGISQTMRLSIIKPVILLLSAGSRPHKEKCWTLTPDLPAFTAAWVRRHAHNVTVTLVRISYDHSAAIYCKLDTVNGSLSLNICPTRQTNLTACLLSVNI